MKKLQTALFAAILALGVIFIGNSTANAGTAPINPAAQVVPVTKRISKKVYRKGRKVTVVTYKHGKRITKTVYKTGNRWGHKAGRKTKHFIMGPSKKTP